MEVITKSGAIYVNKSTPYGKFVLGYTSTPAWSGQATLSHAWKIAKKVKIDGCSWYATGVLVAKLAFMTFTIEKYVKKNYMVMTTFGETNEGRSSRVIDNFNDALIEYEAEVEALESECTKIKELDYSPSDDEMRHATSCNLLEWVDNGDFDNDFDRHKIIRLSGCYLPR